MTYLKRLWCWMFGHELMGVQDWWIYLDRLYYPSNKDIPAKVIFGRKCKRCGKVREVME